MAETIGTITWVSGIVFVLLYIVCSLKKRCNFNLAEMIMMFLYGTGTITGLLLVLCWKFKTLWELIPEKNTYIALGGLAIIGISVTETLKLTGMLKKQSENAQQ